MHVVQPFNSSDSCWIPLHVLKGITRVRPYSQVSLHIIVADRIENLIESKPSDNRSKERSANFNDPMCHILVRPGPDFVGEHGGWII